MISPLMFAISKRWQATQPQFAVDAATLTEIWKAMTVQPIQGAIIINTNVEDVVPDGCNARFNGITSVLVTPNDTVDFLTATDGRVLAIVEVDASDLDDRERLLPKSAACKGNIVATSSGWQRVRKNDGGAITTWSEGQGKFQDIGQALPIIDDKCIQLIIDANYLKTLQEAINCEGSNFLELIIRVDDSGCVTKPIAAVGNEGIGVVVPMQGGDPAKSREKYSRTVAAYKAARLRHKVNGTAK